MAGHYSRREFVRLAGLGTAAISLGAVFAGGPFVENVRAQTGGSADLEVALRAVPGEVAILPGKTTRVWKYEGEVIQGDPEALQFLASYLGPILRVRTGQHLRIHFTNQLPEATIVHWHGLRLPEEMDAHPRYAIAPQETYTYDFTVNDRAATYWFHPHPHLLTGGQVYHGLAGFFIVADEQESALGLPSGAYDIPLVIQDRTFDADNQLVYLPAGIMSRAMTQMMGFLGDVILVNGQPDFTLSAETRAYRLRILNGSNSRIYKLGWDDGTPLTVIGTDGGLLERPVQREYVVVSPGERVELWADFSSHPVGTELRLQSLPFAGVEMGGMMMDMMGGMETSLPHAGEFTVLKVSVDREASQTLELPEQLSNVARHQIDDAVNVQAPRTFEIAMQNEQWLINGRAFEMDSVSEEEVVSLNTLEVWEFINVVSAGGMGGMEGMHSGHSMGGGTATEDQMAHPMHIHGVQFQVIERTVDEAFREGWETVREGYVDEGWKDTILLMPGERVRLLVRFEIPGLFVYHCHNLEHEDLGLMRNYQVRA